MLISITALRRPGKPQHSCPDIKHPFAPQIWQGETLSPSSQTLSSHLPGSLDPQHPKNPQQDEFLSLNLEGLGCSSLSPQGDNLGHGWRQLLNGPLCALSLCWIKRALLNGGNENLPVLQAGFLPGSCEELPRPSRAGRRMDPPPGTGSVLCSRLENKENNQC